MNFETLQMSHRLVLDVYRASASFPIIERYALTTQLRQAAVSVACAIAAGYEVAARETLTEVEYLLLLAQDLEYLPRDTALVLFGESRQLEPRLFRSEPDGRSDPQAPPVEIHGAQ